MNDLQSAMLSTHSDCLREVGSMISNAVEALLVRLADTNERVANLQDKSFEQFDFLSKTVRTLSSALTLAEHERPQAVHDSYDANSSTTAELAASIASLDDKVARLAKPVVSDDLPNAGISSSEVDARIASAMEAILTRLANTNDRLATLQDKNLDNFETLFQTVRSLSSVASLSEAGLPLAERDGVLATRVLEEEVAALRDFCEANSSSIDALHKKVALLSKPLVAVELADVIRTFSHTDADPPLIENTAMPACFSTHASSPRASSSLGRRLAATLTKLTSASGSPPEAPAASEAAA